MFDAGSPVPGSPEYKAIVTQFRDSNLSIMFVDDGAFYGPPHVLIERVGAFAARICSIRGVGSFSKKKTQLSMVNRNPVDHALVVMLVDDLASDAERSSFNDARLNFAQRVGAGYVFSEEEVFSLSRRSFVVLPNSVDYHPRLGVDGQQPDWSVPGVGGSSIVGSFDGCVPYMETMASSLARGLNFNLRRLSMYPDLQARFFMLRVCVQGQLNSVSRLHGLDEIFVDNAFRPMDEAISGVVAGMFGLSPLSDLDRRLVELPVRHAGEWAGHFGYIPTSFWCLVGIAFVDGSIFA